MKLPESTPPVTTETTHALEIRRIESSLPVVSARQEAHEDMAEIVPDQVLPSQPKRGRNVGGAWRKIL